MENFGKNNTKHKTTGQILYKTCFWKQSVDNYKFSKLNNIEGAISCQIEIQGIQYPFSDITISKETSDKKTLGRGGPHDDFR